MTSEWRGFTEVQLWEQLSRCEANIRGYCQRITDDAPSRHKLFEWLGSMQEWAERAASICAELEHRGRAPIDRNGSSVRGGRE
jgi:hypothetical protein